jgi:hypothetical protein
MPRLPDAFKNLSRQDIRARLDRVLGIAALAVKFTPTKLDDAGVALLQSVVDNDEQWTALMDLLGVP